MDIPLQQNASSGSLPAAVDRASSERGRRRRRPSGEPPPLPRHVRTSGVWWLVVTGIVTLLSIVLFSGRWHAAAVGLTVVDDAIVRWLSAPSFPGYRGAARVLAAPGSLVLQTALLWGVVIALLVLRRFRHLIVFIVAWTLTARVYFAVVGAVRRPRPFGVEFRGNWEGWALPSLRLGVLAGICVVILYTLVPEGRWRNLGKWAAAGLVGLVAVGRMALGVEAPFDIVVGVLIGVTIPLVAFRLFAPAEVFPVSYRRGRAAHLDVSGPRGDAIRSALEAQLGLRVQTMAPFGLAGSAGSTPLRITLDGDPSRVVFGKLYARTHLQADRWYKLGRELMYGRLEDEKPFQSVRRLVQQEDYALRLFRDNGLPTPAPYGVVELTPEREYLLITEFFDGAAEMGDAEVSDEVIDSGLAVVRQLWDAGLAHRDIKPSNLLIRDQQVLLIDVAFAELRPTPWRQAVDLANMMLCLALGSGAERVYDRALRQFTVADIGEAFAAARGLALPSQLRRALRDRGLDLHTEFIRLLPAAPQPVSIQRWNARRIALWAIVVLVLGLLVVGRAAFTLNDESTTSLQIANLGCRQWVPLWLEAQAVPSATLVPCVRSLPSGWQFSRADVKNGTAQYLLNHDRAGDKALTARLTRRCDTRGAREVTSGDARIRRFQRPPVDGTQTWYDLFPGGCATVIVHSVTSRTEVTSQLALEAPHVLGYTDRQTLQQALTDRSDGRLDLDPTNPR
jgi:tRNA A-37 threonylcarbamoyl transferase component Bud32